MPITDRKQYIEDSVKSVIGFPVITNLDSKIEQIDYDKALLRYYSATPIVHIKIYEIAVYNQELLIDVATLLDTEFPPQAKTGVAVGTGNGTLTTFKIFLTLPVRASSVSIKQGSTVVATDNGLGEISGSDAGNTIVGEINYSTGSLDVTFTTAPIVGRSYTVDYSIDNSFYFYLGILNNDFRSNIIPRYNLDRFLLGVDIGYDPSAEYNPFKQAARISYDHRLSGTMQFEYRWEEGTKGKIHVISKGIGSLSVYHGFGYSEVDKVPFNHIEIFSNLVAECFLTRVLAIRSTVDLPGDYKINTSFIESKLQYLTEKNESDLKDIAYSAALWDS